MGNESDTQKIHERFMLAVTERVITTKAKYADVEIEVKKEFSPLKQGHAGEAGIHTCLIASSLNCAQALGTKIPENAEELVLRELDADAFDNGHLRLDYGMELLKTLGYQAVDVYGHPEVLVDELVKGDVALFVNKGHAKMISGISIQNGEFNLIEHDPLPDKPVSRIFTLDDYIGEAYDINTFSSTYVIKNSE